MRGAAPPKTGLLERLAVKIGATMEIVDGVPWKKIRKYRAGDHARAERRNVLGVAEMARDAGAQVVLFVRDRDGDESRGREIETAIPDAEQIHGMRIAGGVAIEEIEAWLLALLGESDSEKHKNAKEVLTKRGHSTLEQKLAIVDGGELGRIPADARSLAQWLERCRIAFQGDPKP